MKSSRRLSLTFRLTLLFACTSAAVLLTLGFLIGALVEMHFEELDLDALGSKLELVRHTIRNAQSKQDLDGLPQQLHTPLFGHPGLALTVIGPDRKTLLATGAVDFPDALLDPSTASNGKRLVSWTTPDGQRFRGTSASAPTGIGNLPPAVVAVGMDMSPHEEFMGSFRKTLWFSVILAAILSGLLGWAAVRRELAPVRVIRQRAAEITASHLDQRLSMDAVPAELEELVQTLNAMLARLEESFRRLSDFSSDLAHELRTPVTNMRTQTQVILAKPRTAERYRDVLYSNAEEFERLSRMISDMLFLAKSDHGLVSPFNETVDMEAEVRDLLSFFEALAERKNLSVAIEGSGSVLGDRMLMRRAITNLLSNAIRHTPEHGRVRVAIGADDASDALTLSIENSGEAISPAHLPRLFDRFYRAGAPDGDASEGAGLGLAITKSIVELHGGSIDVQSGDGLTRFNIRLPKRAAQ